MICGIPCSLRYSCLEEQKKILDNYVIFDKTVTIKEIEKYCDEGKNIIWDDLNLYPEIREQRLRFIPNNYHKTALFFNPPLDEDTEDQLKVLKMQFVYPSMMEGFDCILQYGF